MKKPKFDVITIGSVMRDIFTRADLSKVIQIRDSSSQKSFLSFEYGGKLDVNEVAFTLGGGGCNTAVSFSRLGLKSAVVGIAGNDDVGDEVVAKLKKEGVDTSLLLRNKENNTGLSVVLNSFEGERTILVYRGANSHLDPDKIDWEKLASTKWIYLCGMSGQGIGLLEKLPEFIKKNKIKLAWNPGSKQISAKAKAFQKLLRVTDILIMNKEEAAKFSEEEPVYHAVDEKKCNGCGACVQICPEEIFQLNNSKKAYVKDPQRCIKCGRCVAVCPTGAIKFEPWMVDISKIIKKIKTFGPKLLAITDGKRGTQVYDGKNLYAFGIYPQNIIDTLGAGDCFGSTFTTGYITKKDIAYSMKLGTANAASVVSSYGAQAGLLNLKTAEKVLQKNKELEVQKYKL